MSRLPQNIWLRNSQWTSSPCLTPSCPLEGRSPSRTFRYGYLVTTSSQSPAPPSTAPSPYGGRPPASGVADFRDVTGGVYKARERIHRSNADLRLLATPTSRGRVADPDPN